MRIAILDSYTLNPGDLSWEQFQSLGECKIYDRTAVEQVVTRSQGSEIIVVNKTQISRNVIEQLPDLKYIGVLATGYNIVDVAAAAERQIPVTNVPEYGTQAVAQLAFAHVLNFCHHAADHSLSVRQGKWTNAKDWSFWDFPLIELSGLTMGVVGLGRIGMAVARLARAFGMCVLAYDASTSSTSQEGVSFTDIETLFSKSDFVSLHCPLTSDNREFVNAKLVHLLKPGAFLINTSRGGLIDEKALADALNAGRIAGAGLDVLSTEPPDGGNPLLTARNCVITPHIAWATRSARQRLMATAVKNIEAFILGKAVNVVNGV